MADPFGRLSWWLWGGKGKEKEKEKEIEIAIEKGFIGTSSLDWGLGLRDPDSVKFPLVSNSRVPNSRLGSSCSRRKIKKKWHSREERRVDREYDVVMVPSDGVGLTGSESDESDWSIGWLEPHAPDFQSDDEVDDSFAVLVPCYRGECKELEEEPNHRFFSAITNLPDEYSAEGKKYMEQWLSSLQNF